MAPLGNHFLLQSSYLGSMSGDPDVSYVAALMCLRQELTVPAFEPLPCSDSGDAAAANTESGPRSALR